MGRESATSLPAWTSAAELENALGDPLDPNNPLSLREFVAGDEREEMPAGGLAKLRAFGLHKYLIPVGMGGRLRSFEEAVSLTRVICRRDMVLVMGFGSTMVGALPVWIWGTAEQRRALAELLEGGAFGAMGFSEDRAGNDALATATTAVPVDGGFVLDGEKWLIGNATRGEFVTVLAKVDPHLSFFFLRKQDLEPGSFRHLPKIKTVGLRGHDLSGIAFEGCRIGKDTLLDEHGRGMEIMMRTVQITKTITAGMCLGLVDTALRIGLQYSLDRRLYGRPITELGPIRDLLLGAYLDTLICDCVTTSTARALTAASDRVSLWAAVTKYYVPVTCERIVRDLSVVLSARSYLRERVAEGMFQKIVRDLAITSIFEGTTLLQLVFIAAQLDAVTRAPAAQTRRDFLGVDLQDLFSLQRPVTLWKPEETRLRISNDGHDEILQRFEASVRAFQAAYPHAAGDRQVFENIAALLERLVEQRKAFIGNVQRSAGSRGSGPPSAERFALARTHCSFHAAACCLHMWFYNRELIGGDFADGKWLAMCLARLLREVTSGGESFELPASYGEDVFRWMTRHLDEGTMFSVGALTLAHSAA